MEGRVFSKLLALVLLRLPRIRHMACILPMRVPQASAWQHDERFQWQRLLLLLLLPAHRQWRCRCCRAS